MRQRSVVRDARYLTVSGGVIELSCDFAVHLVDLRLVLGARRADLAEARAVVGDLERRVGAARELAVLDLLDRVEHRDVDLLDRRGQDVGAEVGLVGVDADALHALLLGRVERAEAALARDLEDDARSPAAIWLSAISLHFAWSTKSWE